MNLGWKGDGAGEDQIVWMDGVRKALNDRGLTLCMIEWSEFVNRIYLEFSFYNWPSLFGVSIGTTLYLIT